MKLTHIPIAIFSMAILISVAGCSTSTVKAEPLSPNYLAAQEALAADNFDQARTALTALAAESTGDFQKNIRDAAAATDIGGMRMAFRTASDILIKNGVPAEYAIVFCPMYQSKDGGSSWVQRKGSIANPYQGKAMSTCGEFKKN